MKSKTLLFISTGHFHAYIWNNGDLSAPQRFDEGAEGREQFSIFLKAHNNPVCVLTDLIEEDFSYETVPHVRGNDRTSLLQRKLEQYYRNTPFRQAHIQRRQANGRRDNEVLFSALTNPALIMPWLDTMLQLYTPITGIYSVPNISNPLLQTITSEHVLLVSWERHAGLRQSYFNAKRLHFSRLTPLDSNLSFSDLVASEAMRTQQYLKSLSLLPQGSTLDVHIICHAKERHELASQLPSNSDTNYSYLDIQHMGRLLKSKSAYTDSDATPLLLHLLATKPPRSHYAATKHTHFFRLWQLSRALFGFSIVLAVTSLLWSAANIWQSNKLSADSASTKMQAHALVQQTHKITSAFPNTLASASDMKTAVLLLRKLDTYYPPPQKILADLSEALDAFPRVQIDKLSWHENTGADVLPQGNEAVNLPTHTILLNGELSGFSGSYRGALNYLESFQQALTQRGHIVTALTLPLDISPKGSISADIGGNNPKPAQFSLKVIWRHPL